MFPGASKDQGRAGPDLHTCEEEFGAAAGEGGLDVIIFAGGDAAREQDQVGLEGSLDEGDGCVQVVGSDGEEFGYAACGMDLGGEGPGVRVADLEGARCSFHRDDFVSGGENGNAGEAIDRNGRGADGREHRYMGEAQTGTAAKHGIALAGFAPGGVDEFAGLRGTVRGHTAFGDLCVLHHHHRVGAVRERGAGHDADAFAGLHRTREGFAGAYFADEPDRARHVGGANGEAIADGPVDRRVVAVRQNIDSQNAAMCGGEGHVFDFRVVAADLVQDALPGRGKIQGIHSFQDSSGGAGGLSRQGGGLSHRGGVSS